MKIWSLVLVAMLSLSGLDAQAAKRMGGGKSVGKQSTNVTQREAAPAAPAAPGAGPPAMPQRRSQQPQHQLLRLSGLGVPCWAVWLPAWVWLGWLVPWEWVKALVRS